jgi:hypothetical protein
MHGSHAENRRFRQAVASFETCWFESITPSDSVVGTAALLMG